MTFDMDIAKLMNENSTKTLNKKFNSKRKNDLAENIHVTTNHKARKFKNFFLLLLTLMFDSLYSIRSLLTFATQNEYCERKKFR